MPYALVSNLSQCRNSNSLSKQRREQTRTLETEKET